MGFSLVGAADEPALGDAGWVGTGVLARRTGEVPCVPGGQRIGGGTVREDAEHHGDRDDRGGVIGCWTAQFLQGQEAEHYRGQAAARPA